MNLKLRIAAIVICVFVLYGILEFGIQRYIIFPSFLSLEREEAIKDSKRSVLAIKGEIYHLDSLCIDWASWDDTYDFVKSLSKEYIKSNLVFSTFTANNINLLYIIDTNRKVIWGEIHDLETGKLIHMDSFPKDFLPKPHPLLPFNPQNKSLLETGVSGIMHTEKGPMLISSRPILTSKDKGPIRGAVIMGRFLNDDIVQTLVERTQVNFLAYPVQTGSLPESIKGILNQLSETSPFLINEIGDNQLLIYTTFPDIEGKPVLLIGSKIQRKIATKGQTTMRYAIYSIILACFVMLVVMLLLLNKTVFTPIINFSNHVLSIRKTGDVSVRLSSHRSDEIGILTSEFDNMLEQIEKKSLALEEMNERLQKDISKRKQVENEREKLITELQTALSEIKTLRGILPLCSHCKKIRDDKGYWEKVDVYIHKYSEADISHSICPDCLIKYYPEE
jgi:sensor domain CHASE-containing protein